jgi:hypothetical protein
MNKIVCPNCFKEIGQTVDINGLVMLDIGPVLVRELQATCRCGRTIYWSMSNQLIAQAIRKLTDQSTQPSRAG